MKKYNVPSALLTTILLFGCAAPLVTVQPTAERSTPTLPVLTDTPRPLPTATETLTTPTLTPEPDLRTDGPYFAYFREVPGFAAFQFVLMDADGEGRKVIDLPEEVASSLVGANFLIDTRYVSPNGKWLAFYTGSAGDQGELLAPGTFDLTLNLLNMSTGETQGITPLWSKDYPDNFTKAVNEINESLVRPEDLQYTFLAGITQALAWSPDGRYLAFAGQIDGLSSDLYLYDMTTQKIQRLSDDKEELEWINWSPNGRWILHGRRLLHDLMSEYTISAVAVQNLTVRDLGSQFISYWLNANEILQYRMGIETYQLLVVNIDTGNMTEVWEGYFWGHNVDPTGNWIVLNSISSTIPPDEEKPGFAPGIQLINMKSLETIQEPEPLLDPPDLFVRANDGTVVDLPNTIEMIVASPNTKYWAVAIKKDLKIYTQDLTLVVAIPLPFQDTQFDDIPWRPDDIQWSPDSSGLFLMYGKNVYKVNVSERDINLIETNLISSTKWINDQ